MKKLYKNRYSKKPYSKKSQSHKVHSSVVKKPQVAIEPAVKLSFRPSAFATSLYALDKILSRVYNQARAFFNRAGGYNVYEVDGFRYYQASGFFTKCRDTAEYLAKHY